MPAKTPEQAAGEQRLIDWAIGPEGHAKFRWGTPGDYEAYVRFLTRKGVPERMVHGLAAKVHKAATGVWPGPRAHDGGAGKWIGSK